MAVSFTAEQAEAVRAPGGPPDILVSAAAGSGKTAVLTERIVRRVASGETDLDQLLVVTFTEAAAAQMRVRIAARIDEALTADPTDARLARQAALLPSADISTIHAFCRKLLKQHFQQAGLDPAFKVGDETELSVLRSQVMDALFDEEYEREENADFIDLADAFGGRALDVKLDELIRETHTFIQNDPYPDRAAQAFGDAYAGPFDDLDALPWTAAAREELALGLEAALDAVRRAKALCRRPGGPDKYLTALDADEETLTRLAAGSDAPFAALYDAYNAVAWTRLPAQKAAEGLDPDLKERAAALRNKEIKGRVQKLTEAVFFAPPGKMLDDLRALAGRVRTLLALALRFGEAYAEEKRARNLLDFNDLEHYAIRLLTSGPPIPLPYTEVLIDEYQDINPVQERILSAAAGRGGRFMVGDVKQSIYRFRRADPRFFIEKMRPGSGVTRVDLTQNFRSRAEVLDTVNFFFARLMCPEMGEVAYDAQARLYPGASFPPGTNVTAIEIADGAEAETLSPLEQEARLIARCIRERVGVQPVWDGAAGVYRPCRPGDIVILARGVSAVAAELTELLKQNGVDAMADLQTGFFESPEIKTALAFLRVTDNPRQDIELLTALHSPVYAFTPDELLAVRAAAPEGDFYDALTACGSEKAARFLADLAKWRARAAYLPVSRLLGLIYDDTAYPAYAGGMPGGAIRQSNLRLLLERAIQYEETSLTGLFHFTRFIEELHAAGGAGRVGAAQAAGTPDDKVRIMTIHKAKGLEFPIVFVSMLGKAFNREDERKDVLLHPRHGLGLSYVNPAGHTKANTLARYGLSRLLRRESLSEELRVLYVAMTRAKEQLVLTGQVKDFAAGAARWTDAGGDGAGLLPLHYRREAASYLDWLMPCALSGAADYIALRVAPCPAAWEALPTETAAPVTPAPFQANAYPYPYPTDLPSKLSISEIKRLYASDITPDSTPIHAYPGGYDAPAFLRAAQGIDARALGTALHTVAEHMDVHAHQEPAAIEALITELTARRLLTPQAADVIDRRVIEVFMRSPLAGRMRAAAKLHREVPFVTDRPERGERVLVHGIIDCYFEEDGAVVLVDYKSGAVHGDPRAWAETHRVQLDVYKQAVGEATGLAVKEVLLYAFALGREVRL